MIGASFCALLAKSGYRVEKLDTRSADPAERGDIRDEALVRQRMRGCRGVVHLAAVSRVADGESDPELCWQTNVIGTEVVMRAAADMPIRPWILLASSREVYGEPGELPVREDFPMRPVNVYGRSKPRPQRVALAWRRSGVETAVVRLANVYGALNDHPKRVAPAFARGAAAGELLQVHGRDNTFDFTHLDDVTLGLLSVVEALQAGEVLPPIHFASGRPTTLGQLADLAVQLTGNKAPVAEIAAPSYNVSRFVGDPTRARELLGWQARVKIGEGMLRLIEAHRNLSGTNPTSNVA
ncbi:MAG: NAD(P)-dependent oxidoreductase [Rhizobiales bacterium]|nr:NAD(P)-dependent oxidoreductase [Hyphomicrobiales bacterium]